MSLTQICVLSYKDLQSLGIDYSKQHLRDLERAGRFPKRHYLSPRRYGWKEFEIREWLQRRWEESR
jgi:predicted DNA-binding transcriptional regulator AlpA